MHSLPHFPIQTRTTHAHAFTLIELLVVIAIIAILASLLFPAVTVVSSSSKKTTAKNQIIQIATSITSYEAEYGKLPSNSGTTVNPNLIAILTANDTNNNPRAISFIDTSIRKSGKGGTNANGFCDPFNATNVYSVSLDTNSVNSQSNVALGGGFGVTNVTKHIMVWTTPLIGKTNVLIDSWD